LIKKKLKLFLKPKFTKLFQILYYNLNRRIIEIF
jgi:hypothetical protein